MEGFTTWPIRDIIFVLSIAFVAGGSYRYITNHAKHMTEKMEEVLQRLRDVENAVARIEGKLEK